jgi:hypothetical protein
MGGDVRRKSKKRGYDVDLLREYDFTRRVPGKYAKGCVAGSTVVLLEPDVAGLFPDAKSVNETLRILGKLIQTAKRPAALTVECLRPSA